MILFKDESPSLLDEPQNISPIEFDQYFLNHYDFIIGVDEVGRGCLAGPVVSAAVVIPTKSLNISKMNDSKKLSANLRNELFEVIYEKASYKALGISMPNEIDSFNIYKASQLSMLRAISYLPHSKLKGHKVALLVDGLFLKHPDYDSYKIIKGDNKSLHIMAAAILAKVSRDFLMQKYHQKHPLYGFDTHKGYATKKHILSIKKYGLLPIHRLTFHPCKPHI